MARRGRSNQSTDSGEDYSLPKSDILRGRKQFKRLFEQEAQFIRNEYINLRFQLAGTCPAKTQMGFIVKKSLGKAHKRNRTRRLLKEAYRLNKSLLLDSLEELGLTLYGALMAKRTGLSFDAVEQNVVQLMERTATKLPTLDQKNL